MDVDPLIKETKELISNRTSFLQEPFKESYENEMYELWSTTISHKKTNSKKTKLFNKIKYYQ